MCVLMFLALLAGLSLCGPVPVVRGRLRWPVHYECVTVPEARLAGPSGVSGCMLCLVVYRQLPARRGRPAPRRLYCGVRACGCAGLCL